MGTLTVPYDIRFWLYPGGNPSGTPTDWGLPLDCSTYVRYPGGDGGTAVSYTVGRSDEASQVDAATLSLTLDNRTGLFSTKNVASSLYGKLNRNTPCVLATLSGYDTFTRTGATIGTSDSGQGYSAGAFYSTDGTRLAFTTTAANQSGAASMTDSGSADFDVSFTTTLGAMATGTEGMTAAGLQLNGATYLLFKATFQPAGVIQVQFQRVGSAGGSAVSTAVNLVATWAAADTWAIRCQRTGNDVRIKVWKPAAGSEPAAWTSTWTEQYIQGGNLGVFGWRNAGMTNAGSYVMYFDTLTILSLEFVGLVVQWPGRWNKAATNAWAPIQAAGILRRLQQGKGPIKSPMTRQLGAYGPVGWWPLEDNSGTTGAFASQLNGGLSAYGQGVMAGGDSTLAGAGPAPSLTATSGFIRGKTNVRLAAAATGLSFMFFSKMSGGTPASKTAVASLSSTGRVVRWVLSMNATTIFVDGYDSDDVLVSSNNGVMTGLMDFSLWFGWCLQTTVSGATTSWSLLLHQNGATAYYAISGSYSSTIVANPTGFALGASNLAVGTVFSTVWLGPNTLSFNSDAVSLVSAGYSGETAGARLTRLCFEEGIPFALEPGTTDPIGVQPQANILQALRAAADADGGILYERGTGLGYRPRSARYEQAVDLALTVASGQIDDPPEPIDDDQRYRNKWTITNDGGSYAVVQDDVEIGLNGLSEDSDTLTLFSDDYAVNHAGFRLYLGTWPDLRWPGLSLNFGRNPSLIPYWRRRRYGMRMTVTTGRLQVTGADPDVIVEGYTATLWPHGWTVALNCSTARAWDINTLDDDLQRLDAASSTVSTAMSDTTGTSLVVTNGGDAGSTWVPTALYPAEVPFTINVNGEYMTVTSVGTLAGNLQTLTVTRGVNGGAKTHAVGETVRLAYPMILAL